MPEQTFLPWPNEYLDNTVSQERYQKIKVLYDILKEKNQEILALSQKVGKVRNFKTCKKRIFSGSHDRSDPH